MKTIITFIMLLMAILPAGAVKRIDANPINIAFILSQETDSDGMAATLVYYGYEQQNSNDGYSTFRHPNGSIIRISFKDASETQPYPYVEVKSNRSSKDSDDALKGLSFEKKGSAYIRNIGKHAKTETRCSNSHQGYLVFHRTVLPRK